MNFRHPVAALAVMAAMYMTAQPAPAQEASVTSPITGTVVAQDTGEPLAGALVSVGQNNTFTDASGAFSIDVAPGTYTVKALIDGYQEWVQEVTVKPRVPLELDIRLVAGEVIVIVDVGARTQRTQLETPVPVDVISEEVINRVGHTETNQVVAATAPSYNATHQTISDGTDHIDPASLRGLGPDQTLILLNGKRRHPSALVNVNGTFGRGTVGTDLNAIPSSAIKRIEVLRDGASAQYGSDAIAGVVNLVLKDQTDSLDFMARSGITASGDGEEVKAGVNWGYGIKDEGFVNITAEFLARGQTNRAGPWSGQIFPGITDEAETDAELARRGRTREDYTMEIGQSAALVGLFFVNSRVPLTTNIDFYGFGGVTRRKGYASGFYRLPYQIDRVDLERYPDGFLPEINPLLHDWSLSSGVKGKSAGWNWDVSGTYGGNSFHYFIDNSLNASLGDFSPTSFDAGSLRFQQATINADVVRPMDIKAVKSLALVLGSEARFENYRIIAGEPASYVLGPETFINADGQEVSKAAGAQVFPGFQPANEVDEWRQSQGVYAGVESQLTDRFLLDVTGRFENYSDFGTSLNGKAAGRFTVYKDVAVRSAISTGFRAPSLHQIYFNNISTQFVNNPMTGMQEPKQVLTARNDGEVAAAFGIPALTQETSLNLSAGVTARPMKNLSITADVYRITIDDRVVLTGQFVGNPNADMDSVEYQVAQLLLPFPEVSRAQFFTNAVDTTTQGVDLVVAYNTRAGKGDLDLTLSGNFTATEVTDVHIPQGVADKFTQGNLDAVSSIVFNREDKNRLEDAVPRQKGTLSATYKLDMLSLTGRANYYGSVEQKQPTADENDFNELDEHFGAKVLFDADVAYRRGPWRLSIGGLNLFNTLPDKQVHDENISGNRFIYSRRTSQFGINGGFYYLRVDYSY